MKASSIIKPCSLGISLACLIAVWGAGGCRSKKSDDPLVQPKGDLVIIATCDTQGWIEPCGCASGQSGGLSRRATLARKLAGEGESLLLSAGGATFGSRPYDVEKLRAIVAGEAAMGYAVHNIGLEELMIGVDRIGDEESVIDFVSTNTRHPDSHTAPRSVIVNRAGWRIIVLGVIGPEMTDFTEIERPDTAILKELEENRGKYDASVVLAYMDADDLRELAENLPEVDVIIGGKTGQSLAPQKFGPVLLTAVSSKGKFVARVTGKEVDQSRLTWSADLHEVTEDLEEDETQQKNLKAFRESLESFDFAAIETSFVPQRIESDDDGHQFAGTESCVKCHEEDTQVWRDSTHSHAWKTLEDVGAHVDSSCQQCHTTGFGLPGGFVNRRRTMDRIEVGCESCHGPSSAHVADPQVKTPWQAADSCRTCHDHENSPEFEYDPYWEQIVHGAEAKIVVSPEPPAESALPSKPDPDPETKSEPDSESDLGSTNSPQVQYLSLVTPFILPPRESGSQARRGLARIYSPGPSPLWHRGVLVLATRVRANGMPYPTG